MKYVIPFLALALSSCCCCPQTVTAVDAAPEPAADMAAEPAAEAPAPAPSIAGTWEIDIASVKEGMKTAMEEQMKEVPEEQRAMMQGMVEQLLAALEQATFTVEMKDDGTWTSQARFPQPPNMEMTEETGAGTWALDGEKLTIVSTEKNGEPLEETKTMTGTWTGDEMRAREADQPFDMVLRRKK